MLITEASQGMHLDLHDRRTSLKLEFGFGTIAPTPNKLGAMRPPPLQLTPSSPQAKRRKVDTLLSPLSSPKSLSEIFSFTSVPLPATSVKSVGCSELVQKLNKPGNRAPILLDCRPSLTHSVSHIEGAFNINCQDKYTKKRLLQAKLSVSDLISNRDYRDMFRKRSMTREIVLYDDDTKDISVVANPLIQLVLSALLREGKEVSYLEGGFSEFKKNYDNLCETHQTKTNAKLSYCPFHITALQSPTSNVQLHEPDIETAQVAPILPYLFLGNGRDASNLSLLHQHGITHVLNVTSHIPCYHENQGIIYKRLPATDCGQQNLQQYFDEAFTFIDEARSAGGRVLIHCQAGISRSATVTIAYLMKHSSLAMIECYKRVKNCRPIISPNFNFMGQLLEFEGALNSGRVARQLEESIMDCDTNSTTL